MPAVDPAQARARAAAVAGRFYDFPACAAAARALLADYADHARRASARLDPVGPAEPVYQTPAPVVRMLVTALRELALVSPQATFGLLPLMWAGGSREERCLSAELLGAIALAAPAEAWAQLETWLPQLKSAETVEALARHSLAPLAGLDPAGCLARAQRWITHPSRWVRRFALAALEVLAACKDWDDVPAALAVVRSAVDDGQPDVRHAAAGVVAALLPKSPPEINLFLREQALRTSHQAHLLVRALLPRLEPEERDTLLRLMRA